MIYQANEGEKISSSLRNCRGGVVEVAVVQEMSQVMFSFKVKGFQFLLSKF